MRKKTTLPVFFSALFIVNAYSSPENVCVGNVALATQAEVNSFNCTSIEGTLTISGDDITDLSPLSILHSIGEGLEIYGNASLTNVDGLSTLKKIGDSGGATLKISDNPALVNLHGLSSLRDFIWTTNASITITNNALLEDLTGLLALRAPADANQSLLVDLRGNPVLDCGGIVRFFQSLGQDIVNALYNDGKILTEDEGSCYFQSIMNHWLGEDCTASNITLSSQADVDAFYCTEIGQTLIISGPDIVDLTPLIRLKKVGELIIENNPLLQDLEGLSSLERIDGMMRQYASLKVINNPLLGDIDGLSSLKHIRSIYTGEIVISNNPLLKDVDGLTGLEVFEFERYGSLQIKDNASLEHIDGLSSMRLDGSAAPYGLAVSVTSNPSLTRCTGLTPFFKDLEETDLENLLNADRINISNNGSGCTLEDVLGADPPEGCGEDMLLTSQAEVDAFACSEVKGLLKISGEDITDLSPLSVLRKVGRGLVISDNPVLANLDGLANLDSIKGGLVIRDNEVLMNVDGLSSLRYLQEGRDGLLILNNSSLINLDGFSSLTKFSSDDYGFLSISYNSSLESIHGLSSLRPQYPPGARYTIEVVGNSNLMECGALFPFVQTLDQEVIDLSDIRVTSNGGGCTLESFLSGFPYNEVCYLDITLGSQAEVDAFYCSEVDGKLTISGNDITNLDALSRLRRVESLVIENNPKLENLDGLLNLDSMHGSGMFRTPHIADLIIKNNSSLKNIDGLSSLKSIYALSYGQIEIVNNPLLENVDGLSSLNRFYFGRGGGMRISNNAALKNLNGLSSLSLAKIPFPNFMTIRITENPSLSPCIGLFPFLSTLDEEVLYQLISTEQILINSNGPECDLMDVIANGKPFISTFALVNTKTGMPLSEDFFDSTAIDIGWGEDHLERTLQAKTYPKEVGSVQFIVDGIVKFTDNRYPYTLPRFVIPLLQLGTHTVRTEVYEKPNGRGKKGVGRTAKIRMINSATITGFDVVDRSGNIIKKLEDGDTINILDPAFSSFTIVANTSPTRIGGVKFHINKRNHHTDKSYRYSLNGDRNGVFYPWKPRVGSYVLQATPFASTLLKRYEGQSMYVHFKVVAEIVGAVEQRIAEHGNDKNVIKRNAQLPILVYPVPVKEKLFVELGEHAGEITIVIRSLQGQLISTHRYRSGEPIETSDLTPGVYLLHVEGRKPFNHVTKFVKE